MALRMAIGMFAIVAPLQLLAGHESGKLVLEHQPLKTAAIEAYWKSGPDQPQSLVGLPDRGAARPISNLPFQASATWSRACRRTGSDQGAGRLPPREDWPVVGLVYWAFRVMVGLGLAMIGLGVWGVWLIAAPAA
jgi:cytochrome d ubiquinol oxidase subunit I